MDPEDTIPGTMEELRPWLREMRAELHANTEATKRIEANTSAMVEAFQAAQGFWSTVTWIGDAGVKVAKFVAAVGLTAAAAWLWVKTLFEGRGGS